MSQFSFFNIEEQLDKINGINDFLYRLNELIHWSIFLDLLNQIHSQEHKSNAGRPSFDVLLMFKILILKHTYNLSDDQVELQIRDRLSFRAFWGLSFADRVPDSKTIWLFGEQLARLGLADPLFHQFHEELRKHNVSVKGGIIVDSTFVDVPKQHFHRDEYQQIKKGEKPASRTAKPEVESQTDFDARYTKKNGEKHYGYKNHVLADSETKIIVDYEVTDAATHDNKPFLDLVPAKAEKNENGENGENNEKQAKTEDDTKEKKAPIPVFGDSAFKSKKHDAELRRRGFDPQINEKGYRNHPLTDEQKANNKLKSKTRCRIEHIFGAQKMRMGNEIMRTIGKVRAAFQIGMRNLVYNMSRLVRLKRPTKVIIRKS
ncbi:MAG: IS5 family transposase [Planctomycetaceae bacterium]|jgi:IS5 family transposase|nr:IS5 family transposase [Planctomycetaceae bacterium]